MTMFLADDALAGLTDVDSHAIAAAACRDFQEIGDALCAAARLGDATALHHHRHALSGLCRILGADHLEQAAHASFIDEADFAAFDACLRATITALQARAIISQKGREP